MPQRNPPPTSSTRSSSSSPGPSTPPNTTSKDTSLAFAEKPRLTEQEKKNNHIASEQKRRQVIREGFDRLTELVPGLEGQARSESIVLRKSLDFMRQSLEERKRLIKEIEELGGEVPEELQDEGGMSPRSAMADETK